MFAVRSLPAEIDPNLSHDPIHSLQEGKLYQLWKSKMKEYIASVTMPTGWSLANVDFSQLKVLPSEDLKPVDIADSDMNVFDQQLFGKVETNKSTQDTPKSEGVLAKKSPQKEDHFNTKGKTRKTKGHSAFDFINRNSTPVSEEVTSTNYDSRELKQGTFF